MYMYNKHNYILILFVALRNQSLSLSIPVVSKFECVNFMPANVGCSLFSYEGQTAAPFSTDYSIDSFTLLSFQWQIPNLSFTGIPDLDAVTVYNMKFGPTLYG